MIIYRYRREKGWGVTEIYPPRKIENYVSLLKNDSRENKVIGITDNFNQKFAAGVTSRADERKVEYKN